jgi:hypothetical protein
MKTLILTLFASAFLSSSNSNISTNIDPDEVLNSLQEAFESLDSKKIVAHIDETIILEIHNGVKYINTDSECDRAHAYAIIKVFFNYHKAQRFYPTFKGLNNEVYELRGVLVAEAKNFRVTVTLMESRNRYFIRSVEFTQVEL